VTRNLECILANNVHGRFCVPASSRQRPAAQAILNGGVWEPDTIAFVMANAGAGDIVHAGTYFGDFLPGFSRAVLPGNRVWAFEPNPENFHAATITRQLNRLDNVEIFNAGLGHQEAPMKLRVRAEGQAQGGASRIVEKSRAVPADELVDVPVVRVDDVVPRFRRVSVLQLDVEGFEQNALTGALETIAAWRPIVIVETLPEPWVVKNLVPLGYSATGRIHDNTVLRA
jgi:FkbM family methyltransferase